MPVYVLLNSQSKAQNPPAANNLPNVWATPAGPMNPNMPPQSQAFEAVLNGVGSCSASVQIYVTNDPPEGAVVNWTPYGPPIALTGTSVDLTPNIQTVPGNVPWRHFAAAVASISGTNASVTFKMSA